MQDSTRTITLLIALGVVLAATSTFFFHMDVDQVPLKARDVGPEWMDNWQLSPRYPSNWTVADNFTYSVLSIMSNETSIISSELLIFKSPEQSLGWFQNETTFTYISEDAGIGDMGYIFRYGGAVSYLISIDGQVFSSSPSNIVGLIFVKGNILSKITALVKGIDTPIQPWVWNFTAAVGLKQLEKIDQYLAQHPGAS